MIKKIFLVLLIIGILSVSFYTVSNAYFYKWYLLQPGQVFFYVYEDADYDYHMYGIYYEKFGTECLWNFDEYSMQGQKLWSMGGGILGEWDVMFEEDLQNIDRLPRLDCDPEGLYVSSGKWYKWEAAHVYIPIIVNSRPCYWCSPEGEGIENIEPTPGGLQFAPELETNSAKHNPYPSFDDQ